MDENESLLLKTGYIGRKCLRKMHVQKYEKECFQRVFHEQESVNAASKHFKVLTE